MSSAKRVVRVLLLSDTHGRLHPAIRQLADSVEHIVHAGDIGDLDILTQLASGGADLLAIRGNNDTIARYPESDRVALGALTSHAHLELPGGTLVAEHGHRANPVARRHAVLRSRYPHARLIVYGHSHRQCIDRSHAPVVANPGAAGRSRTFGGSACILLSASAKAWELQTFQFPLDDWKK